ncbi:betaine--homocysteine S-methyltransferase [Limibacillus halophilus]|jgi:methionine synthase I (cobalamin-dependent)
MQNRFLDLLQTRPWLLADGATGTNLFAAGLMSGDAPELWNVDPENEDKIYTLNKSFVDAGSDIVLTNSFGGNRYRLKLHNAQDRVAELNLAAARLARRAADSADRTVVVAGSIGPTGEIMEPVGSLSQEAATQAFAEQAAALAEGGADVLWIETISSVEELSAAVEGAGRSGLPVVCTLSFDTNGRTMMGVTPAAVAQLMATLSPRPAAYGANCGTGASELVTALLSMKEAAAPDDVLIAKSNCGIPRYEDGQIVYSGTPELMADYARLALDAGARIIGGCCGTTPEHVRAMRASLESYSGGDKPSLEAIVSRLGEISAGSAALGGGKPLGERPERGGRRRRENRRSAATQTPDDGGSAF